ncbi:SusC/RagA family TonB-linked outer membrane protein [Phocaeicola coprocola]|jgi:TonB-linked SusC/RagA family outer membrane protein|uniref:TonB-dependent receptor n=1 Tax=Phocaeicola coprocola TaxID=310298 RepID=A0A412GTM2_9BACT|nr:TonB-dependent receptor [Phocaeicola coprocola]RGR98153.1 TonB-dependent receptor [Phocaeicola coprocola]
MKNIKTLTHSLNRKANRHFFTKELLVYSCSLGIACFPLFVLAENDINSNSFSSAQQENRIIKGKVIDEKGETLIGVSILVKGTTIGTVTDFDGNFSLEVPKNGTLVISYVGYKSQEIKVSGRTDFAITLASDNKLLDEVVVVGYGVVKKSDLTGSVGSVKSETIAAKGSTSVMESLQGQVAGVNISQSSSRAGDGFKIQIRGKSSLNEAEPLYVIDGVVCDNMDFLNPMDIEKVDVLKDASSTAIYGSRATNGVVMITTKKGASDESKATVSYDGYYGVKTVANMPDFMDGDSFLNWRFWRYLESSMDANTGQTTWNMTDANYENFWGGGSPVIKSMYQNKNYTDWTDLVTRTGAQQNHFVNITGNAKNISYRVGLGYQDEKGVLYDGYNRWNLKGAVDHKISDKVSAGFSTNMATSLKESGSNYSVLSGFRMTPTMPAYYWEGENAGQLIEQPGKDAAIYPNGGGPTSNINPLVDRENSKDDTRSYDIMANLYLQYSPIKELILKTTFSPMYSKTERGTFYNGHTQYRSGKSNMAEKYNDGVFSYTWDTQANYIKTFGDHSINVLALFSVYDQRKEGDYMGVVDMPFDVDWHNLGSGTVQNQSSYYERMTMLSYVARLNYSYKGKYMATVSSRWDGSSKFQKENRWGMFPSAALAWRISEENFMESTRNWLSNLKLRASFGVTGNNAGVGPYDTQALANIKYYYNYGGTVANGFGYTMINPDLTWEKTVEFNVGLDFGLFNNRINGTIDLYNKNSSDLLMEMQTPFELGSYTGAIISNVGKVNNKGIEIQLNTLNVQTKDWNWETSFSFARNINTIKELNGGKEDLVGNKWFIGQPIDVVYGYKYMGVCTREEAQAFANDPNMKTKFYEGEMKIYDKDGNGEINADDKMILGHCAPTWTGSFVSNLAYKNWDFSVNVYVSQGGTVYSPFMGEFTDYSQRGMNRIKMDFYIPEGAPKLAEDGSITTQETTHYGEYPFPTNGTNGKGGGSFWMSGENEDRAQNFVDNSYVKIKNITLGYTFPKNRLQKLHISNLRVFANILNPLTFTSYKGFDPEWADAEVGDGTGGVSSRSWQFGINLKF